MIRAITPEVVTGKCVVLRLDLNVPLKDGRILDDTRLQRGLPMLRFLQKHQASVVILAHFGRPQHDAATGLATPDSQSAFTLRPVAAHLAQLLDAPIAFLDRGWDAASVAQAQGLAPGAIAMLENVRFYTAEEANDPAFAQFLGSLGDVYINDAFSASHRAHASLEGITHVLPAYAGFEMQAEIAAISKGLENPQRPMMAIVGGAKVSTKVPVLENLLSRVDVLALGGGIANTFLAAMGHDVGTSLCERDMIGTAQAILAQAQAAGVQIFLPQDVVVARTPQDPSKIVAAAEVPDDMAIYDWGPVTLQIFEKVLAEMKTVVWNGPLGLLEIPPFDRGSIAVAQMIAARRTEDADFFSLAGGGETVMAVNKAGVADQMGYVSTAGGAFLEWLEGKTLPGVRAVMAYS